MYYCNDNETSSLIYQLTDPVMYTTTATATLDTNSPTPTTTTTNSTASNHDYSCLPQQQHLANRGNLKAPSRRLSSQQRNHHQPPNIITTPPSESLAAALLRVSCKHWMMISKTNKHTHTTTTAQLLFKNKNSTGSLIKKVVQCHLKPFSTVDST